MPKSQYNLNSCLHIYIYFTDLAQILTTHIQPALNATGVGNCMGPICASSHLAICFLFCLWWVVAKFWDAAAALSLSLASWRSLPVSALAPLSLALSHPACARCLILRGLSTSCRIAAAAAASLLPVAAVVVVVVVFVAAA